MQTRWKTSNMVQAQKKVGTHKPAMYSRTTTLILESKHDVDTSNTIIPREMHAKIPCKILKNNPKNSKKLERIVCQGEPLCAMCTALHRLVTLGTVLELKVLACAIIRHRATEGVQHLNVGLGSTVFLSG